MKQQYDIYDTVVIGGGPAGLAAAIAASGGGRRTALLEQQTAPGSKLLVTGNGRCNLTNILSAPEMARDFGGKRRFTLPALYRFPPEKLRNFFEFRGVPLELTDGFHYFPASGKARDILNALLQECEHCQVEIFNGVRAEKILAEKGKVCAVRSAKGKIFRCSKVIISTGGKSYPALGSSGSGYELAAAYGHNIITPVPAMVGLRCAESWVSECAGIAVPDAESRIDLPGEKQRCRGDLLFTKNGISAFAVLNISGRVAELLQHNREVPMRVNLFPDTTAEKWMERFKNWSISDGSQSIGRLLSDLLPKKLIQRLTTEYAVPAARFSAQQRRILAENLTGFKVTVNATEGWQKAQVTRGGIDLSEVDQETLQSRLLSGLYFAGEVLDIDGPCGGYNLQWAFSSGFLAGDPADKKSKH